MYIILWAFHPNISLESTLRFGIAGINDVKITRLLFSLPNCLSEMLYALTPLSAVYRHACLTKVKYHDNIYTVCVTAVDWLGLKLATK